MGLTCRLLGHAYGDPETERERQERGDEVVVSIRELQVCTRCGHEQVISENKEVTAIRTPAEVGMTEGEAETAAAGFDPATPEPDDGPAVETASDAETGAAADVAPAESPTGASAERSAPTADAEATPDASADRDEPADAEEPPVTDDGIILDDDDEAAPRDRTQWPDDVDEVEAVDPEPSPAEEGTDAEFIDAEADDPGGADAADAADAAASESPREYGAWPDPKGADEGWDAEPDDGEPMSVSFGGGLTPETDRSAGAPGNGEYVEAGEDDEFVRAEEADVADAPDDAVEYYCPNCGLSRGASSSSMRAGDICPECRKGYIAEREV